jgi:hypothetical protein
MTIEGNDIYAKIDSLNTRLTELENKVHEDFKKRTLSRAEVKALAHNSPEWRAIYNKIIKKGVESHL